MADQGIVERLRVRQREWEDDFEWMNGGRDSLKRAKEYQEAADHIEAREAHIEGLEAARDALEFLEGVVTAHYGVELGAVVGGFEACLTTHDGATTSHIAEGPTLIEAIAALREAQGGEG